MILHQTADKKSTPAGEAESLSIDWDRWEIGNADQMVAWIQDQWGLGIPGTPLTLEQRVERLEREVFGG